MKDEKKIFFQFPSFIYVDLQKAEKREQGKSNKAGKPFPETEKKKIFQMERSTICLINCIKVWIQIIMLNIQKFKVKKNSPKSF